MKTHFKRKFSEIAKARVIPEREYSALLSWPLRSWNVSVRDRPALKTLAISLFKVIGTTQPSEWQERNVRRPKARASTEMSAPFGSSKSKGVVMRTSGGDSTEDCTIRKVTKIAVACSAVNWLAVSVQRLSARSDTQTTCQSLACALNAWLAPRTGAPICDIRPLLWSSATAGASRMRQKPTITVIRESAAKQLSIPRGTGALEPHARTDLQTTGVLAQPPRCPQLHLRRWRHAQNTHCSCM